MDSTLIVRGIIKKRRNIVPELLNGQKIDREIIEEILEAANWAPTHKRTEPWRFIVYEYEKTKDFGQLHADTYKENTPEEDFLENKYNKILNRASKASHLIVAYVKRTEGTSIPIEEEIAATAAAVQNMLLLATAHQISVHWGTGGMCYHPAMKEALSLEEDDFILGWLFFGRTDDYDAVKPKRITPIKDKIKWM